MGEDIRILGRIQPRRVDRRTAQAAEENFHERLATAVAGARSVFDPLDGRLLELSPATLRRRVLYHRADRLKDDIKRLVPRDLRATYDAMPKSLAVLYEVRSRPLVGPARTRLVIAGAALSPVEDLLRDGESDRPISATDLAALKDEIAARPDVFHYLCVFATTSWADDALAVTSGPNFLAALADIHEDAWRVRIGPDPRAEHAAHLFDLTTWDEKIEAIRRFVDRHVFELLMDEMTEDYVAEHLAVPPTAIREAFERIEHESEFIRFDAVSSPPRLVRVYT